MILSEEHEMIENLKEVCPKEFEAKVAIVVAGMASARVDRIPSCCGRAYVFVGFGKLTKGMKAAKILEKYGFKLTPRPYGTGLYIYVGYDNADGYAMGKAEMIAAEFKKVGIVAGADGDAD